MSEGTESTTGCCILVRSYVKFHKNWITIFNRQLNKSNQNAKQCANQCANLPPHLHHQLLLLLHPGTSGPQNRHDQCSARSSAVTARFQFCPTSKFTTFVSTVRKICGFNPLHPHQSTVQLLPTSGHTNEHFQPIPQLHRKMARTFLHTGWRGCRNQSLLHCWQSEQF